MENETTNSQESVTPDQPLAEPVNSTELSPLSPVTTASTAESIPVAPVVAPEPQPSAIFPPETPVAPAPVSSSPTVSPTDVSPPPTPSNPVVSGGHAKPKRFQKKQLAVVGVIVALVVIALGSYGVGKKSLKPVAAKTQMTAMSVPQGATIIEQCEPGLGTQYVLPKDIPTGPVYNVYKGKLIGTEYMVSTQSLQTLNTSVDNLPLFNQPYDHINIMSMSAHAGFPEPHFQVDVMMVPKSVSDKITCGTGSSTPADMTDMNM